MSIADKAAMVDQNLLQLAREAQVILSALRARYQQAAADPRTKAADLAQLQKSVSEIERAIGRVRFQPAGAQVEGAEQESGQMQPAPAARKSLVLDLRKGSATRGGSGRYARHGSADHLAGHRRVYHQKKEAGEIDGSREDWQEHLAAWAGEKEQHQTDLLKELRHLEAECRGMDEGPERSKCEQRIGVLRGRLGKRGVKC